MSFMTFTSQRRWSFPRQVWLLGFISLLTDTASEAIYPFLPAFLIALGASPTVLGMIEGAADAVSSFLKVVAGRLSDRWRRRQPIVAVGYSLASIVRPLLAFAAVPWQAGAIRVTDRVGKGLRGAPRDALLAEYAGPDQRGRVFGFHRAMDHVGAIVGPLLAAAYLWFRPDNVRELFLLTIIPGIGVILLLLLLREAKPEQRRGGFITEVGAGFSRLSEGNARGYETAFSQLPGSFWRLMMVLAVFTLGNSTDAFLLVALGAAGFSATEIALIWAAQHVVKAASSLAGGAASDRYGRRTTIAAGWAIYAGIYFGFGTASSSTALLAFFLAYGLYYGLTEGAEKALIADQVPPALRGTAFGVYGATLGFGLFAASTLFGWIWQTFSPSAAFFTGATLALLAALGLATVRTDRTDVPTVRRAEL